MISENIQNKSQRWMPKYMKLEPEVKVVYDQIKKFTNYSDSQMLVHMFTALNDLKKMNFRFRGLPEGKHLDEVLESVYKYYSR